MNCQKKSRVRMSRIFLLIILLLTGCSNSDRSTSDNNNQEQTEQSSSELSNEVESNNEQVEEGDFDIQFPRTEGGLFSMIFSLILWGVIVLIIVALAVVVYLKRKRYKDRISELERKVDKYYDQCRIKKEALRTLKNRYRSLEENLKKEKKERKELAVAVSKLQAKSINKDFDNTNHEAFNVETEVGISKNEVEEEKADSWEEELFFTVPNKHGKFKHDSGTCSFEEKRLYKLTYQRGESEGTIEFISSKYDGVAINLKDSMIKPACNIMKENENNSSSVHQISPGKVKREGEEWVIASKIKVEIL